MEKVHLLQKKLNNAFLAPVHMIPNNLPRGFVPGSRAGVGGMGGRQRGFMGFLSRWAFLLAPPFHSSKPSAPTEWP